jgi:hypothetical protein
LRVVRRRENWFVSWEPPFESDPAVATIEALFEINAKLGDIRDHVAFIRRLVDDDGEEEEETD